MTDDPDFHRRVAGALTTNSTVLCMLVDALVEAKVVNRADLIDRIERWAESIPKVQNSDPIVDEAAMKQAKVFLSMLRLEDTKRPAKWAPEVIDGGRPD